MDNERSTDVGVSSANGEKNLSAQEKEWVNTFLSWNSSARRKVFNHLLNESIDFRHLVLSSELVSGSASAVSFTEDSSSVQHGHNPRRRHKNSFFETDHSSLNGQLNTKKKSPSSVGMLSVNSNLHFHRNLDATGSHQDNENQKRIDLLGELASDMRSKLMSFFDGTTIATSACVSRKWRSAAYANEQDIIWQREFIRQWPSSTLNRNNAVLRTLSFRKLWQMNLKSRRLWLSSRIIEKGVYRGHTDRVRHVRVRGKHFVTASWDGTLRVGDCKDLGKGEKIITDTEEGIVHRGSVFGVFFDGIIAGTCSEDHTIQLWHIQEKKTVAVLEGHQGPVYRVEQIDSEKEILVSCALDFIGVWHWPSATLLHKLTGHKHDVHRLKVNMNYIVTGSYDETIRVWEYPSCEFLWTSPPIHQGGVSCLHMCASMVGSGSAKGEVHLWDLPSGKILFRDTKAHIGALVTSVWICANENKFITSSITSFQAGGGILCFWAIDSGECMFRIEEKAYVNACRYEFGLLFMAYSDGVLRIRDLYDEHNSIVREEPQIKGQLYDVDVQGSYVVACGMNRTFCLKINPVDG